MPFEGFPFIVGWELTLTCDLRCAHCGSSAGQPRRHELTTAEALELCEQFPALLVQEVDFTGGEPLLRRDWPLIAERLIELGIATNVLTNGLALNSDTVARMKELGISGVGISLDGLEATHDRVRNRQGSFAAVLRSIALLQDAGLPLNVITTVNARNLLELPMMLDLLRSAGVGAWRLQPLIPMGRVLSHTELHLDSEGLLQLGRFAREHKRSGAREVVRIICSDGLEYVDEEATSERPWRGCSAGIVACGIRSDGKVKGCLSLPDEFVEGDLRERSFWDLWFDPHSFTYTRGFAPEQLGPNCLSCEKALECKGGCSSSSYCGTGRLHNDALCFHRANVQAMSAGIPGCAASGVGGR
jgi:radical SAM protein with 4Fe4S-binding SPASM domain